MEEADAIIFPILKDIGCELPADVNSIKTVGDYIYNVAASCINAIDPDSKLDLKLPKNKAAGFRLASAAASTLKQLGYQGEVGYQSFLYPNENDTRKIISFLIERVPRPETSSSSGSREASTTTSARVKLALHEFSLQRSTLFTEIQPKPTYYKLYTCHLTTPNRDSSHTSSPSPSSSSSSTTTTRNTVTPAIPISPQLQHAYWKSNYHLPYTLQTSNRRQLLPSILSNNTTSVLKASIADELLNTETSTKYQQFKTATQSSLTSSMRNAVTQANQEQQQRQLSSYTSGYKPSNDGSSSSKKQAENAFARKMLFTQESTIAIGTEPVVSAEERQAKEQEEYNVLVEQRASEINQLQQQYTELMNSHRELLSNIDHLAQNTSELESRIVEDTQSIETLEKQLKTKKHVIDFLPNAQENIVKLRQLTEGNIQKISKLNEEWENLRQSIIGEIRAAEDASRKKRKQLDDSLREIQRIRENIKAKGEEVKQKEDAYALALEEYEKMPKSVNRNVYIRRIMDIVKNIEKQNDEIVQILSDVRTLQRDITNKSESVQRSFTEADDLVYSVARTKRDPVAISIYKDIISLRDGFIKIIDAVEEAGKRSNKIREMEQNIDVLTDRGASNNISTVQQDLDQIKQENAVLKKKLAKLKASSK